MSKELTTHNARAGLALSSRPSGFSVAPTTFHEVVEFAKDMSRADTAIPKHLRGNPGACMAVALQAFEWGMSPFAVANKSYSVNDRVAYEAQLIAAVVNTRSGIQGRLKYKFEGEGPSLRCTVTGVIDGETLEYRSPLFKDITTKNSPLWKSDPEQQFGYYSARAWARRHVPEVILGVYDREEVEAIADVDNTPPPAPTKAAEHQNVIDVESEAIEEEEAPAAPTEETAEEHAGYGNFPTMGEYMDALETGFAHAKDAADIEEVWTEFDPLATFQDDEDAQDLASRLKERALARVNTDDSEDDEPPSTGGLFQD